MLVCILAPAYFLSGVNKVMGCSQSWFNGTHCMEMFAKAQGILPQLPHALALCPRLPMVLSWSVIAFQVTLPPLAVMYPRPFVPALVVVAISFHIWNLFMERI